MENKKVKISWKEWFFFWCNMTFKMRFYKMSILWYRFRKSTFKKVKPQIDNSQQKSIDLFIALLKNKETSLNYSPESSTRIIESDFVWVTLTSKTESYLLNIIDETDSLNAHSHEIYIPKEHGFDIVDEFDIELEKRFRAIEVSKKRMIIDDLDKLIAKVKVNKK